MTMYKVTLYYNEEINHLYETYVKTDEWYLSAISTAAFRYASLYTGKIPTKIVCMIENPSSDKEYVMMNIPDTRIMR